MEIAKAAQDDEQKKSAPALPPVPATPRAFFDHPELMAVALEAGNIGIWSWDVATKRVEWSSNVEEILGLPEGSFTGSGSTSMFEDDVHPEDRPAVRAAMQETLQTHKPRRVMYRLQRKQEGEERWIETLATVVVEQGTPVRMLGLCRDVSDRARVHHELRVRAAQQEAIARLGERALTESDLQKFFDEAVATCATLLNVELAKILELVPGDAELLLRSGVGWKPEVVGRAHVSTGRETHAGFALAAGGPVITENLADEKRFVGAPLLTDHNVVSGVALPIAGRDGRAYGVLTVHTLARRKFTEYDVSFLSNVANVVAGAIARLQLDRRQELMIRELRHRSGNLFSQLLALFSQTAKNSRSQAELVTKYEARVLALANAHRLITEGGWKSASLTELLNTLLAPYLDRMSFTGPNVFLEPDATFGLSMAVHELVSNASQHGSLTRGQGRVDVTWSVERAARGLTMTLDWKERGGPAPKRTRRPGFGTKLITSVIERQLNGEVQQTFAAEGADTRLIVPITHERWPGAVARTLDPHELT